MTHTSCSYAAKSLGPLSGPSSLSLIDSIVKMELVNIPYATLLIAFAEADEAGAEQTFCNTHEHPHDEVVAALNGEPSTGSGAHLPAGSLPPALQGTVTAEPPLHGHLHWLGIGPWSNFICASQHITEYYRVLLQPSFLTELEFASGAGVLTGTINAANLEDLQDTFPTRTVCGVDLSTLFASDRKWFVRLDTCSLKDSRYFERGKAPAKLGSEPAGSAYSIYTRLATSPRASRGIGIVRSQGQPVVLYLFPWREDLGKGTEYRVFCPPVRSKEMNSRLRISAISQYKWHAPWQPVTEAPAEDEAQRISEGCRHLLDVIQDHAQAEGFLGDMRVRGFVFDVLALPSAKPPLTGSPDGRDVQLQLIELNPFGATTGCGSALFHWLRDAKLLYGLQDNVELRITR